MGPVLMADSSFLRTNVSLRDQIRYTVNITFLKVKMEDYGRPFTCHAGVSAAYIILIYPGNTRHVTCCSEH